MKGSRRLALVLTALLLISCIAGTGLRHAEAEAPGYVLKAVNLAFEVDASQFQREIERYNAALSRYEGAELLAGPPKAADPDGKIRQTLDALRAQRQPYLMPMDSGKLFTMQDGVPTVYHLARGQVTLLAPDETMSQAYYDTHYKELLAKDGMFEGYNDGGLTWSSDGNYLLMSFLDSVLRLGRLGSNTLLADIRKGSIRPIDRSLPPDANYETNVYEEGYPIRACFHDSEPIAYVEYFNVKRSDSAVNQIRAHHLITGQTELLGEYPATHTPLAPALGYTRLGVAHSIIIRRDTKLPQAGIAFHGMEGETRPELRTSKEGEKLGFAPA